MGRVRATVFGLDVWADAPLALLKGAAADSTRRRLELSLQPGDPSALRGRHGFEPISDQRTPDGTVDFRIEAHPQAGYVLWGPRYGAHLLSPDGRRLRCVVGDACEADWQRLLIAQVLPFAAVLHGLEVFHASAVVFGRGAVALVGPSRAGKTSVALALCRLGASFLADDVLTLERCDGGLVGHPGSPLAGVAHAEAARLTGSLDPARVIARNERELLVRMPSRGGPVPLSALFVLDRRPDGPAQPCFEPVSDARTLLAATFNLVLDGSQRLSGLLDVCARVARRRVERVLVGPAVDPAQLGAALAKRLGESV
jgi:hypothetical protein